MTSILESPSRAHKKLSDNEMVSCEMLALLQTEVAHNMYGAAGGVWHTALRATRSYGAPDRQMCNVELHCAVPHTSLCYPSTPQSCVLGAASFFLVQILWGKRSRWGTKISVCSVCVRWALSKWGWGSQGLSEIMFSSFCSWHQQMHCLGRALLTWRFVAESTEL